MDFLNVGEVEKILILRVIMFLVTILSIMKAICGAVPTSVVFCLYITAIVCCLAYLGAGLGYSLCYCANTVMGMCFLTRVKIFWGPMGEGHKKCAI